MDPVLRTVTATRYVLPLREGGSLPGLMEADDLGTWVVKFTGAGQGRKVLVAEVLVGELARRLGLPVPELVLVDVDPVLGRAEPDEEIQDLLRASPGLNLGTDFLPGSLGFDPVVQRAIVPRGRKMTLLAQAMLPRWARVTSLGLPPLDATAYLVRAVPGQGGTSLDERIEWMIGVLARVEGRAA